MPSQLPAGSLQWPFFLGASISLLPTSYLCFSCHQNISRSHAWVTGSVQAVIRLVVTVTSRLISWGALSICCQRVPLWDLQNKSKTSTFHERPPRKLGQVYLWYLLSSSLHTDRLLFPAQGLQWITCSLTHRWLSFFFPLEASPPNPGPLFSSALSDSLAEGIAFPKLPVSTAARESLMTKQEVTSRLTNN